MKILVTHDYTMATRNTGGHLIFSEHCVPEEQLGMKRDYACLSVNVENPAGTERIGIDPNGHEWRIKMKYDYGFIPKLTGEDGEGIDVYLGPDQKSTKVFVVHQVIPDTGEYDEDKVMLGFNSAKEAKEAYLEHYDKPGFFGAMDEITMTKFKLAIKENDAESINWKKKGVK